MTRFTIEQRNTYGVQRWYIVNRENGEWVFSSIHLADAEENLPREEERAAKRAARKDQQS